MSSNRGSKKRSLRGQVSMAVIALVILAALAILVAAILRGSGGAADARAVADSAAVRRGTFDITIPVSGELAALRQIEIRNRIDGRAVINEIIDEGTNVQVGDVLLRLNDDEIRSEWRQAKEKVNTANAAFVTAEAELQNTINERDAELAKAQATIMLADLALKAWLSGEHPAKQQELELALETAEKDHQRLEERFAESAKLLERKFISLDEYKRDEIAMIEARSKLAQSKLDLEAYINYQSLHDKASKESDLEQARLDRKRIEDQFKAQVQSAEIEVESKRFQLQSAEEDLSRLDEQLKYTEIRAPSAGLVVYTSSLQNGGGRNEGRPPVVGTEVSKNESVIILPDVSQMIASVKVSESLSGTIRPGQRATVTADANPSRVINGEVLSVGVLAESGGWRDPNRRDYTVKILLKDGYDLGLKPSMRCKADIYVGRVSDTLYVPIQAVFRNGPLNYVYVPSNGGYAQRKVTIGRASELYIEIKEGLEEGETVLLRDPATEEIVSRLPAPKREEQVPPEDIGEAPESRLPGMQDGADGAGFTPGEGERGGPGMGSGERGGPGMGERSGRRRPPRDSNSDDNDGGGGNAPPAQPDQQAPAAGGGAEAAPSETDGDAAKPAPAPSAPAAPSSYRS